ncbi:TlpA family protein disulfide reductase [Candidatus Bealeia paramacronuclearis]|uniref:TlpA family protein disulfide reductase n=1 Tax=Candidatus Bealeia paramacronuclearis TaxID=1921001 RepID=A0ABZ2C1R9_9PROT|nr:TlpA family protein disulfide reductase [Candidatus Bealeia paramacronuclearis]
MNFWKKSENWILTSIVLLFFMGLAVWNFAPNSMSLFSPVRADPMTIPFVDKDQKVLTLDDFKGKPTVVNFWATWCPVCVKKMDTLNTFAGKFQEKGGQVLALSHDRTGIGTVKAYYLKNGYTNLPIYLETSGSMLHAFGGTGLPTAILINANGEVVAKVPGGFDWESSDANELVETYFGIKL